MESRNTILAARSRVFFKHRLLQRQLDLDIATRAQQRNPVAYRVIEPNIVLLNIRCESALSEIVSSVVDKSLILSCSMGLSREIMLNKALQTVLGDKINGIRLNLGERVVEFSMLTMLGVFRLLGMLRMLRMLRMLLGMFRVLSIMLQMAAAEFTIVTTSPLTYLVSNISLQTK